MIFLNTFFVRSCGHLSCFVIMIKLVAGCIFINVAPLKFHLTFSTTLFSVIHTVATKTTRSVGGLMIFVLNNSHNT